jgi:VIT1/CCC1 family predicted Fe2+/Mn2+ transporter
MPNTNSPIQRYLKDIVFGASDGIVTTLVVISSVAGASMSPHAVLVLGLANLVADGFSMGVGNVLAVRSTLLATTRPPLIDASRNGMATFAAFVLAGAVPLATFLLAPGTPTERLFAASLLAGVTLFAVGGCRALLSDRTWLVAGLEMLCLGAIASAVAYAVGSAAARLAG